MKLPRKGGRTHEVQHFRDTKRRKDEGQTMTRHNGQLKILNILQPKKENFQIKNSDNFHISSQNIGTH